MSKILYVKNKNTLLKPLLMIYGMTYDIKSIYIQRVPKPSFLKLDKLSIVNYFMNVTRLSF